jgi:hypothetical protein
MIYAQRVSTDRQSLFAQLAELKAAKCEKIFQEKISGALSDRKQLARLMAVLGKGGRLGRHQARSIGEVDPRSPQSAGDDHRKRGGVQIAARYLG